jgi:lysyl-tRNA synthetase class 2
MTATPDDWRPTASRARLERRASALAQVRAFFATRGVMEVDTPIIVNAPVTDVHIHSAEVRFPDSGGNASARAEGEPAATRAILHDREDAPLFFLHTSPEFAMKRLLAAGSGDIYQICHVARGLERGRHHNAEFTLTEWYRNGFTLERLMDEVEALARHVLGAVAESFASERVTYRDAFVRQLGIDPLTSTLDQLQQVAHDLGLARPTAPAPPSAIPSASAQPSSSTPAGASARSSTSTPPSTSVPSVDSSRSAPPASAERRPPVADPARDECLDLLMAAKIGPKLGRKALTFIHRYPASQAALARLDPIDPRCALRFELYCEGLELANGFHELASASEQRARFEDDRAERQRRGLPVHDLDQRLLDALSHGLPDCAGVALGFDRLLMLASGATHIDEVIPFPIERA